MSAPINKKIKILHVTSTPMGIGGVERLLLLIAENYNKDIFELHFCNLFSKSEEEIFLRGLKERGFSPYCLKGESYLAALSFIPSLTYYIEKNKIDIVHTWLLHSNFIGQVAAALPNRSIRVLSRQYKDYFYIYDKKFEQKIDRISHHLAHKIIACSHGIKKHLVEVERIPDKKIEVIYNSVDLDRIRSGVERKQRIIEEFKLAGKKCIGVIANLHPRKGHIYLFEALSRLKSKMPDIRILCVGDGVYKKSLQEEVARLNLYRNVIFAGYREDIPELISVFDLVVQPSIEEGFGMALIEAMSLNKPIIATSVGGIPEVIGNYAGGILVPPRDSDALAKNIEKIISSPDFIKAIGNKGRELVELNFGIEKMVRNYENIYQNMFAQKRKN